MTLDTTERGQEAAVTEDRLLGGRVRLAQAAQGYRVALDPVLLAAAVPAVSGEAVLDLGCGSGAAALCLLARVQGLAATGLEIDPAAAALARANAAANGQARHFRVLEGDIGAPPQALQAQCFDHVLSNPPYLDPEKARLPADPERRRSHAETGAALATWIDLGLRRLRDRGTLTLVHRAERLDEILAALAGRAGEVVICPLWPGSGKPAKRIVVRARKGSRTPLTLHPGLVLHRSDGGFTPEAEAVLRDAAALDL